jgi:hypothetical protein
MSSEDSQDTDEEITRRWKPIKKGMYEKTPVDGVFLAIQTLEEEKLIKRYHSRKTHSWKYHEVVVV